MGAFNINITGVGGHGCDRKAKAGEKLYGRCGRYGCPDCMAYEFVQQLRQRGMLRDGDVAEGQELLAGAVPPSDAEVYYTDAEGRLIAEPVPNGKRFWRRYHHATFTHWPSSADRVVDDMLKNERTAGRF